MTEIPNCLNKWGKKSPLLSSCHSLLHIHLCTQKIVLIFSFVFPQTVRETKDTGEWSWVRTAPPGEEGRGPGCAKGGLRSRGRSAWVTLCVCVWVCVCAQSRPTLCNPMDSSPPGSSVYGIFQARILENFLLQGIFSTRD